MTQPTGYPLPPGQFPPGFGYPQPPKKTGTAVRALAAIFGLALVVLAGVGVKTTFFDKKNAETSTPSASTASRSAAPSPGRAPSPTASAAPPSTRVIDGGEGWEVEAGCIAVGKSPEECAQARADAYPSAAPAPAPAPATAAPAPEDGGYIPATPTPVAVQKYLRAVRLDAKFAPIPDQELVDAGLQGCVYLSTATGATPLSNGEGFAAQIGVPRTQAMEILGAATGAFCREFIDKMVR
jgi:hypothetical protein